MEYYQKKTLSILVLLISVFVWNRSQAQTMEYQIKASIIYKFTKHTKWPNATSNSSSDFVVCVLGKNPFQTFLSEIFEQQKLRGKKTIVYTIKEGQPIPDCHVIFIDKSAKSRVEEVVKLASKNSILTCADTREWEEKGICVNLFITKQRTVRFKINEESLKNSNLSVDTRLLHYSRNSSKK